MSLRPASVDPDPTMSRPAVLHPDGRFRCPWPGTDPFYVAYHDEDWGVPEYDGRALFEKLILDGFQAGLSWITILRKRERFREVFDGFEPAIIARYGPEKVEALMADAGIVRNRGKILGTIEGAKAWLALEEGAWLLAPSVGPDRRPGDPKPLEGHAADSGRDAAVDRHLEGPQGARLPLRRPDHRLCLHAGCRHGQ